MGQGQSTESEHKAAQAKAAKSEWQAQQAREHADALARGMPYEKKKYLPPGTFEARPYGFVKEESGYVQPPAKAYERQSQQSQQFRESRQQSVPQSSQVWYQPERREVEFEAPSADRPGEREALERQQRSTYRVMDVSQNYDASQGPAQHQQPATEVRYPTVQSWSQRGEHPTVSQTQQAQVSADTRVSEIPPEGQAAIDRLKAQFSRGQVDFARKIKELEAQSRSEESRFRQAIDREKELRMIDARELEELADLRQRRAELLHRQRQLQENEKCRQQLLKDTKPAWEHEYESRMLEKDTDLIRLRQIEEEDNQLKKQMDLEKAAFAQAQTAAEAEAARLMKIRQAEENLRKERERLDRDVAALRENERKHADKLKDLRTREADFAKKQKELRTSHVMHTKAIHDLAETEFNKTIPLTPADQELAEIEKKTREITAAENEARSRENEALKQLKAAQKECEDSRAAIEKLANERESMENQRPVIPAKQVCAEIEPSFKRKTEELRSVREVQFQTQQQLQHPQQSQQSKQTLSFSKSGIPEAPPLSEKTKAEYYEYEKRHPSFPDHPSVTDLEKQHQRLRANSGTTHLHNCPCPVTSPGMGPQQTRSPAQPPRMTNVNRELGD